MLKHGEVNPLNVHRIRRTEYCPLHFTSLDFDLRTTDKTITDWVYENLEGRFWMGDYYKIAEDNAISINKRIAFELAAEASYFGLFLDQINKTDF